jgi:peptidyl-prolyl cis-trans isomerase D
MEPFLAKYDQALEAQREASETKQAPPPLPEPIDPKTKASLLKQKADALALNYVMTPLMTREEADRLLPIGSAHEGTQRLSDTPSFAEHFFDERSNQYEPTEFIDAGGTRYLAWKFAQQAEYIPTLDDIRPQVADAWKRDKARGLAEKEAKQLAEAAKKSGDLKAAAGDRLVLTTADITKLVPPLDPRIGTVRDSEIAEIPNAGKALRDAFFSLQPGEIKVEANAPKTTYYVLALNRRSDVDLKRLFSPFGERIRLQQRVGNLAFLERQERWTDYLLQQAGPVQVIVPPREDRGDEGE